MDISSLNKLKKEREYPFYSRKYRKFFKDYEAFKLFDKLAKRNWIVEKHGKYKDKWHLPAKYTKGGKYKKSLLI